ncbi:hypothetical protein ACFVOO_31065 [Streptomyces rochei]|uniref:Uncharacterized protein n=1 Tax=Streptomyces rochei TaxID=1928 RepID=A0AAX3ZPG8_STRRO|nr:MULTISPECIES: hypothetical protein [Streptomyces]RIH61021.1 hypothetical protein D3C59_12415 [Streptomyces sp. SHP22-7]MBJ6621825.1 hypothetical protein [Streptomyces sp. DHE17-7]MBX4175633.1 hypothetical protein [Streptomyces geysiriensis]PVD05875.1 hypothetical protein DBP22_23445 [Streptomyces sp. CS207]WMC89000.1 hypothetical protein P7W03_26920 [Streptomyces rochei]
MREKPDAAGDTEAPTEGARRIDLSVPQVAGSALAAVVAAKLASSFGVYGTILGAGLISVIATCGGSVLQHFFKRTGEQLRVKRAGGGPRTASVPAAGSVPASAWGEFTEGTVYRARTRGWKRPLVAAALVFGVTMAGITAYELASGENLSGGHSTTVGSAFTGHHTSGSGHGDSDGGGGDGSGDSREHGDSDGSGDSGGSDSGSGSGDDSPAATPSGSPEGSGGVPSSGATSDEDGGTASSPTPTPEATGDDGSGDATGPAPDASATAPEPGASSRSGTADPGQDGPAAR